MGYLTVIGSLLFASGLMLLGFMHVAIATYSPHLGDYSESRLLATLSQISGTVPYFLSIVLAFGGAALLVIAVITSKEKDK
ncbi:hypothetical protein ACE1TF_15170 [Geomicrobium sp. JSM 1781026]|uniref:hypothetical protein n=1 Tax=Geomicrobium sp. JSM 1781026 TaxID=3344580 RepID=UPI0035C0E5A6